MMETSFPFYSISFIYKCIAWYKFCDSFPHAVHIKLSLSENNWFTQLRKFEFFIMSDVGFATEFWKGRMSLDEYKTHREGRIASFSEMQAPEEDELDDLSASLSGLDI
jgi:hypothetical protein